MADNREIVYKALRRNLGLTPAQAAGAVGGLTGESGPRLDPNALNPSSGAYGIGQWLGGRKTALQRRGNPASLSTQMQHLISELRGPERAALQRLKGTHTIEDATRAWVLAFERPAANETTLGPRTAAARQVFNQLGGSPVSGGSGESGGRRTSLSGGGTRTTTTTTPGVDNSAARAALISTFLEDKDSDVLDFALQARSLKDIAPTVSKKTTALPGSGSSSAGSSSVSRGNGVAEITGPNPKRIVPQVRHFMQEISAVRGGKPVVGSDGTGHSYRTVNGNVSEHSTGHASDIPARGGELINLGQAALIAAGMPRTKARQQTGGLFNVVRNGRRYQIIFNTQQGGDHTDHLHVGVRG